MAELAKPAPSPFFALLSFLIIEQPSLSLSLSLLLFFLPLPIRPAMATTNTMNSPTVSPSLSFFFFSFLPPSPSLITTVPDCPSSSSSIVNHHSYKNSPSTSSPQPTFQPLSLSLHVYTHSSSSSPPWLNSGHHSTIASLKTPRPLSQTLTQPSWQPPSLPISKPISIVSGKETLILSLSLSPMAAQPWPNPTQLLTIFIPSLKLSFFFSLNTHCHQPRGTTHASSHALLISLSFKILTSTSPAKPSHLHLTLFSLLAGSMVLRALQSEETRSHGRERYKGKEGFLV